MQTILEEYGRAIITVVTVSILVTILFLTFYDGELGFLNGGGSKTTKPQSNDLINVMEDSADGHEDERPAIRVATLPKYNTPIYVTRQGSNPEAEYLFDTEDGCDITITRISNGEGTKVSVHDCIYVSKSDTITFVHPGKYILQVTGKHGSSTVTETFSFIITV